MYDFANSYMKNWFPNIPSYPAFVVRLNRLSPCFKVLSEILIERGVTATSIIRNTRLLDSMPIITCSGKRKGKVTPEIMDKSYNATKVGYFYAGQPHLKIEKLFSVFRIKCRLQTLIGFAQLRRWVICQ
jgi:hypothetical protein